MRALCIGVLAFVASVAHVVAQDSGAPPGIYKPGAEIMAELDRAAASATSAAGVSVTVSPGVSVRRRSSGVGQFAVVHPYSVEVYRILEGSGTLVTGGLLELPLDGSTGPNIMRSENGIKGGLARQVSAGDILVLQPGTPHWFSAIDGESITYMETRIQITSQPVQFQPR